MKMGYIIMSINELECSDAFFEEIQKARNCSPNFPKILLWPFIITTADPHYKEEGIPSSAFSKIPTFQWILIPNQTFL